MTTLRLAAPFVDDEYPDLLFLVPKRIARQWRFSDGQTPDRALLTVHLQKGSGMMLLDLPTQAILHLRPRGSKPEATKIIEAQICHLDVTDARGRCAEIEIVVLF
jgi:hypothetical protein